MSDSTPATVLAFEAIFQKIENGCDFDAFDLLGPAYKAVIDDERATHADRHRVHLHYTYIFGERNLTQLPLFLAAKHPFKALPKAELFTKLETAQHAPVSVGKHMSSFARMIALCMALLMDRTVDNKERQQVFDNLAKIQELNSTLLAQHVSLSPVVAAALAKFNASYDHFVQDLDFAAVDKLIAAYTELCRFYKQKSLPMSQWGVVQRKYLNIVELKWEDSKELLMHPKNPYRHYTKEQLFLQLRQEKCTPTPPQSQLTQTLRRHMLIAQLQSYHLSPQENTEVLALGVQLITSSIQAIANNLQPPTPTAAPEKKVTGRA